MEKQNEYTAFNEAVQNFKKAAVELNRAWDDIDDGGFASRLYPFDHSFDEMTFQIIDWAQDVEGVVNRINNH